VTEIWKEVEGTSGKYTQIQLGKIFGVRQTTISAIVRKENWDHI